MATSNIFGEYNPNQFDFVPFVSLIETADFKVIMKGNFKEIYLDIKNDFKKKSNVKIAFNESTITKGSCTLKFDVLKGNDKANDPDGNMCYLLIAKKGFSFGGSESSKKYLGIKKYGDTIQIICNRNTMQTVDSIAFYFKDNSDDWTDLKGNLKDDWLNCGNISILDDCVCSEWMPIRTVIPANLFEGYKTDCHVATNNQLAVMGYKEGTIRYQISKALRDQRKKVIKMEYFKNQFEKGVVYIKESLKKGVPVTVGIDNHDGITPGNPDLTTDHFVVITGMGTDDKGNFFNFYDNASNFVGSSPENKLYCLCKENKLSGKTDDLSSYGSGSVYTVTSIRTSVKK